MVGKRSTKIPNRFKRSLPYLKMLQNTRQGVSKVDMLRKFPQHVTNDLVEIIYNVVTGAVHITPTQKARLRRHKKKLIELINLPSLRSRRTYIYKQKGGFLSLLLPAVIPLISNLISSLTR